MSVSLLEDSVEGVGVEAPGLAGWALAALTGHRIIFDFREQDVAQIGAERSSRLGHDELTIDGEKTRTVSAIFVCAGSIDNQAGRAIGV